jgi:peptidoglycan hydrolase CwlO-like protein
MSDKKYQELTEKRQVLENELKVLEKQIFDLETKYLEETATTGNVIKGWEGYTTIKSGKLNNNIPRKTKANPNDRIFS